MLNDRCEWKHQGIPAPEKPLDEVFEAPQITTVIYCEKLIELYVLLTGSSGLIY